MVRATLRLRVHRGRELDFERAWLDVAAIAGRFPGNLRQALLRDPGDPRAFTITSDWVSAASFRAFERSDEQDVLTAELRRMRESAELSLHQLLVHVDADPA
jgi:heme-degrading monooxygenase HmoA